MMTGLTTKRLRELLSYAPYTGDFTRLVTIKHNALKGAVVRSYDAYGYLRISIDGRRYRAHRLAWFYMTGSWPPHEIDHINGVRDDNRFSNLRLATHAQNHQNKGLSTTNTSGLKGASWHGRSRKWRARIVAGGRQISLGYFSTPEDAHASYCTAALEYFSEFARAA
jgi:HNH endonuclease/AP2 domain